jgi:outer membrane protein assembly factor BamB
MKKRSLLSLLVLGHLFGFSVSAIEADQQWPQWRGPLGDGNAPHAQPPIEWSETQHVKWKAPVPGSGSSTPVVWGDRIFLLTAIPAGENTAASATSDAPTGAQKFTVLCLNRTNGAILWQKVVREEVPHEAHHKDHGYASATPVTDGTHVYAYFGSRGLYCLDFDGNVKWERDFGDMKTRNSFGEGSSPALSGDAVIVSWDHEGEDFIAALDKKTGQDLWRKQRDEATNWTTPYVLEHEGVAQVVVNGTGRVRSYSVKDGSVLWEAGGQTTNAIPTPVSAHGMLFAMSGFRGSALHAIRLGAKGDLTGSEAIAWSFNKGTPYVPSPLICGDELYFLGGNNALLSIFDARTGTRHVEAERLTGIMGVYASPVAAAGRIYLAGRDGGTLVLKAGKSVQVLATNRLEDRFDASPALVGKELFLRGQQHLYCISEE